MNRLLHDSTSLYILLEITVGFYAETKFSFPKYAMIIYHL